MNTYYTHYIHVIIHKYRNNESSKASCDNSSETARPGLHHKSQSPTPELSSFHPESPFSLSTDSDSACSPPASPISPMAQPESPTSPHHLSQEPQAKKSRLNHSDLGAFVHSSHSSIADNDKYHLIREHFVPTLAYNFPQSSSRRSFQYSWLSKFQWLRYSEQNDGGYCLPCALFFRPKVSFRTAPEVLVTKPLTNFQKALAIL